MADTASTVHDLATPAAAALGLDVLAVEHRGAGSRQVVRVVVDRKGGVPLDLCQELSRALADRLDEVDPISGRYTLEVTSPGTDWPLTDRAAFDRVEGRDVLIHHTGEGAVEQLRGRVVAADAAAVRVAAGDREVSVAYDDIVKATQALPW